MKPAVYSPQTVNEIRVRAQHGMRLHAIARYLNWDVQQLRRIAARHQIFIIEESPDELHRAVNGVAAPPPLAPAQPVAAPARPTIVQQIRAEAREVRKRMRAAVAKSGDPLVRVNIATSMRTDIRDFAAGNNLSIAEAYRRLLAAGLAALDKKRNGAGT